MLCVLMALAVGGGAGSAGADPAALHAVVPATALHGARSPFKLARSAARGIVGRRDTRGSTLDSPLSSPLAQPCSASCASPVLYHGGPVMHREKLYVIEWEPIEPSNNGQAGTTFEPLPAKYAEEVGTYLKDVAADSGKLSNVYSVETLYGEPEASRPGEYSSIFGGEYLDTKPYPARSSKDCPSGEGLPPAGEPCIADAEGERQLGDEVASFVEKENLPTGLGAIYFVLMPHDVNSCAGFEGEVAACNSNFYCAYHSDIVSKARYVVYANMPYDDVEGCQTPDQPHESPADDEIDTLSHENNEAITDPLGNAWFDYDGNEIADKCTYPFFDPLSDFDPEEDDYGPLIGGTRMASYEPVEIEGVEYETLKEPGNSYNQTINGGHFLLQREWSNATGGCVQHAPAVKASFVVTQQSETELTVNAGLSTTEAGEIAEYNWKFSGGDTASGSVVTQRFPTPGEYTVTLTVVNNSGASATTSERVTLQTMRTSTTATTTTTVTAAGPHYTAAEIAKLLGLPHSGAKLSGLGSISLGHAECPPACGVGAKIFVTEHDGRRAKRVQIGSLNEKVAEKGTGSIELQLTAKGKKMLRKGHTLAVTLVVTVDDAAGANWKIERHLTLTSAGKAARRSVAARNRR